MAVASGPAGSVLAGPVFAIVIFFSFEKKRDIIVAIYKERVKLNA